MITKLLLKYCCKNYIIKKLTQKEVPIHTIEAFLQKLEIDKITFIKKTARVVSFSQETPIIDPLLVLSRLKFLENTLKSFSNTKSFWNILQQEGLEITPDEILTPEIIRSTLQKVAEHYRYQHILSKLLAELTFQYSPLPK